MKYVFFTFRDFVREGGGTIRMYGLLNALAEKGHDVVLISNAQNYSKFHPAINHEFIGLKFKHKALFQALLVLMPVRIIYFIFKPSLSSAISIIQDYRFSQHKLIFFEYLDNSIGYLLKKTNKIKKYSNDVHGIATIEFDFQRKKSNCIKKIYYTIKYIFADRLDKKVFTNADGIIYSSSAMKKFFESLYKLENVKPYVIPNLLSNEATQTKINSNLKKELIEKYNLKKNDFVLLFAGGFKVTSGVDDLIEVFSNLKKKHNNIRLIIIGSGPLDSKIENLITTYKLGEYVIKIERIDYQELITYQSLANLIVCPDRMNVFSNLVVHFKYLDALISERLVLNGSFDSVMEINDNDKLSLSYTPGNKNEMFNLIEHCIENFEVLLSKYKDTRDYAIKNLTYSSYIHVLTN